MFFFMMMIMFIVVMRAPHMRRRHSAHWHCHSHRLPAPPRARMAGPQPDACEQLKTRYVQGELSDEQYEAAVDELLRTPEGRLV